MGRALSNTLTAYNAGAKYLDGTIMGMGRGLEMRKLNFCMIFLMVKMNIQKNCLPL